MAYKSKVKVLHRTPYLFEVYLADEGTWKENAQTVRGMRHQLAPRPHAKGIVGENSCVVVRH